jgi:hypothetical protein
VVATKTVNSKALLNKQRARRSRTGTFVCALGT